jgi:FkbM family methyltransferase
MLMRLYLASRKHKWLYPIYLGLRMPLILPALVSNEGFRGAVRWLQCRVALMRGKPVVFHSRHGFELSQVIDFVVYDEIFIERCYDFKDLPKLLHGKQIVRVVDFGMHHGLFIDYVKTQNSAAEIFGAEMSPVTYGHAAERLANRPGVTVRNVAIGGSPRKERISLAAVSTEQRLNGSGDIEVEVTTPDECLRAWNILGRDIDLLKMDIEGAEQEVFENMPSIAKTLASTKAIVMEIHTDAAADLITKRLASLGFKLVEQKSLNFFFLREK